MRHGTVNKVHLLVNTSSHRTNSELYIFIRLVYVAIVTGDKQMPVTVKHMQHQKYFEKAQ
jgi:hypothetical protein